MESIRKILGKGKAGCRNCLGTGVMGSSEKSEVCHCITKKRTNKHLAGRRNYQGRF